MKTTSFRHISILLSVTFFIFFRTFNGHGMMCTPRQRGAYHEELRCGYQIHPDIFKTEKQVRDYCGHCLNGGTTATVRAYLPPSGWGSYDPLNYPMTLRRAGLCGDPRSRFDHMLGGSFMPYSKVPITAVWQSGSEVDLSVEIDTNHNGYFEFHLCDIEACGTADIDEKCFEKKKCYRLERVPHKDCQNQDVNTNYECGPIDDKYKYRWYVPCRNSGHVGVHIVGGESGTMRFKLPPEIKESKHSVVQWYWATANSCNPPGQKRYFSVYNQPFGRTCNSDGGALGAHNPTIAKCQGSQVPEEFWSCADVQISKDGKSLGPVDSRAKPSSAPPPSGDEDRAKKDTEKIIRDGKKAIEEDIENEANESDKEKKRQEEEFQKGNCLLENMPCDVTIPCCDVEQVCVYTLRSGMFTCRFWWGLWQQVEDQEKLLQKRLRK